MKYDTKFYENYVQETFNENFCDAHFSKLIFPDDVFEKLMEWKKSPNRLLFFAGNPGVGKTYLSVCIAKMWVEQQKHFRCFNEKIFLSQLKSKISENHDIEREIKKICESDNIILDDIGASEDLNAWQREQLFSFLDHRYSRNLPTVITSNLYIEKLSQRFSPRFVSRIRDKRNVVIELNWIDKRIENF